MYSKMLDKLKPMWINVLTRANNSRNSQHYSGHNLWFTYDTRVLVRWKIRSTVDSCYNFLVTDKWNLSAQIKWMQKFKRAVRCILTRLARNRQKACFFDKPKKWLNTKLVNTSTTTQYGTLYEYWSRNPSPNFTQALIHRTCLPVILHNATFF